MNLQYNKYQISELIFLYINKGISEKQNNLLFKWINESKRNKELFEKIVLKETYKSKLKVYVEFEKQNRWKDISYNLNNRRNNFLKRVSAIAVIFLILVPSFGYLYYNFSTNKNNEIQSLEYNISIIPGSKNAILVTEEGEIDLSKKIFNINTSSVSISNNKNSISYQKMGFHKKINKEVYNTIIVPRGGEYKLILSDGTQVWLNSESIIKYPVSFNDHYRKVWLKGEAYFKVVEDKTRPFSVKVDDKSVEVLGTSFNVKAYEDENRMVTTLQSGSVKFKYKDHNEVLTPNHQIVFSNNDKSIEIRKADISEVIAWVSGEFYFKSLDLKEIMIRLGRWYDFEVYFENKKTEEILFRGYVNRDMKFQEVVNIIQETSNVRIFTEGKYVSISSPKKD